MSVDLEFGLVSPFLFISVYSEDNEPQIYRTNALCFPAFKTTFCGPSQSIMCLMCVILLDLCVYLLFMYEVLISTHILHLILILKGMFWYISNCTWLPLHSSGPLHVHGLVRLAFILCSSSVSAGSGYFLYCLCCFCVSVFWN